jgi:drug/metabolite transporter (DMT)-like permease
MSCEPSVACPPSFGQGARSNARIAGILWMVLAMASYSFLDAQTKYLSAHMPVLQVVWARAFGMFAVVGLVLWPRYGLGLYRTQRLGLQLVRGVLVLGSAGTFILAISYVPLADAAAITFVGPLLITALGALVLKEGADGRHWIVLVIGLFGTMVVIRPGLGVFQPEALIAFASVSMFAFFQLAARSLRKTDEVRTTISWTALVGAAIMTAILPFVWVTPSDPWVIVVFCTVGIWGGIGEFAMIKAITVAPIATVAPFQYTMILWATLWGFTMFGDLPDLWTLVGAGILIATGLYSFYRDREQA